MEGGWWVWFGEDVEISIILLLYWASLALFRILSVPPLVPAIDVEQSFILALTSIAWMQCDIA